MNLVIRKGKESDLSAVFDLIKELAEFEKQPESVTNSVERMRQEKSLFGFFVAEIDQRIVGVAIYFFAYFTWVGKSLYLDDLYVKSEFRGQAIGSKLLRKIFELAKEENCHRIRWQVLDWNTNAIDIYKQLGAHINGNWLNCDIHKEDIDRFFESKS